MGRRMSHIFTAVIVLAVLAAGSTGSSTPRPDRRAATGGAQAAARQAGGPPQPSAARPPNIVLILADDLGYGDLGSYGHPIIRTPRIDRLAREGLRFSSYYAGAPSCTPSRAALLTGRYPIRVGLPQVLGPEATNGLPRGEVTLADGLKTRGYRTMMIGKWHLGHARPEMLPTAHGFDDWFGLPYSNDMLPPFVQTQVPLRLYRHGVPEDGPVDQDALTMRYTEAAVEFVRKADASQPFFLYLAHNMPHLPIHAPARFRGRSAAGLYGDVIEMLDWSTGEIVDALAARGLTDNTIVVFTSDNGPWLDLPARMLQDGNQPWHAGSAGLLRGAKGSTWEGGMRVPAIVTWPRRIAAGQVSAALATSMDLSVTLLEAAGAPVPPDRDGHSLAALFDARSGEQAVASPQSARPATSTRSAPSTPSVASAQSAQSAQSAEAAPFFYFQDANLQGVREGPWKLRQVRDEPATLFHLDLDPSERYDRAAEHPEIVQRLRDRLRAFAATLAAEGHAPANFRAKD